MAKLTDLKKLLKILRENGIEEFKNGEMYVKLSERAYLSTPMLETSKFEPDKKQSTEEEDLFFSGA